MPRPMRRKAGAPVPKWDGRPFHIFAADPGGTTGVATAEWHPDNGRPSLGTIKFRQWEIEAHPHHALLWCTLGNGNYTQIVWETFDFRQHVYFDENGVAQTSRNKVELISREYIGVMELFCQLRLIPNYHTNSSHAMHFITDEKIKQLGLWLPGMTHAMDATRHLLRYMVVVMKLKSPFVDIWLADD